MIYRVIAANNSIRGFFSYSTDLVKHASKIHGLNPVSTAALGRLLIATSMMGLMQKSEHAVITTLVKGDGPMKGLCVTAKNDGSVKGYVFNDNFLCHAKDDGHLDVGGAIGYGTLTVIKDLGMKEPYNSTVPLVTGELGEDLTYYFSVSEQTPTSVGLGVLFNKETIEVSHAGGFIVQVMPDIDEEILSRLENNIGDIKSVTDYLKRDNSIFGLMDKIFDGLGYEITEEYDPFYSCDCNKEKIIKNLMTIDKQQLLDLFADDESIEVKCHMCNSSYNITVHDLFK